MTAISTLQTVATLAGGALDDFGKVTRPIHGDIMRHYSPVWRWVGGKCIRSYRCKHTGRGFRSVSEIMRDRVWLDAEEGGAS